MLEKPQNDIEMKRFKKFGAGFVAGGFICAFVLAFFFPILSLTVTPAIEVLASVGVGVVTGATSAAA